MTDRPPDAVPVPPGVDDDAGGALDASDDTIVYDLSEWTPDQVDTLEWALGREGVPSVLRDGELTIQVDFESRVDYLIDHLFDDVEGVELDPVDDEGDADLDAMEALGDLFVAVDRLTHAVDNPVVQAEFEEAATALDGFPVPFGFEAAVWDRIRMLAGALTEELDAGPDEVIRDQAAALRDLLRQYV